MRSHYQDYNHQYGLSPHQEQQNETGENEPATPATVFDNSRSQTHTGTNTASPPSSKVQSEPTTECSSSNTTAPLKVVPAVKDHFFDCSECTRRQRLNGQNNGVLCTKCFRKALKSSTASSSTTSTDASNPDAEMSTLSKFDRTITTVKEARQCLEGENAEDCDPLDLDIDDWQECEEGVIEYCERLMLALQHKPTIASDDPSEQTYQSRQETVYEHVVKLLQTPALVKRASAITRLAADEVIKLHKFGVPKTSRQNLTSREMLTEVHLKCSDRFERVVAALSSCKYLSKDVLNGKDLHDLARNPDGCVKRKFTYFSSNSQRTSKNKLAQKLVRGEACNEEMEELRQRSKRPLRSQQTPDMQHRASEHDQNGNPAKPARSDSGCSTGKKRGREEESAEEEQRADDSVSTRRKFRKTH